MGYERNDRRFGNPDRGYGGHGEGRGYGRDEERGYRSGGQDFRGQGDGRRDYGRDPRGYDYQDRGFMDRAGDEVRSWFGDEEAERRRQADDRYQAREDARGYRRDDDRGGERTFRDRAYTSAAGTGAGMMGDYGYGAGYYGGRDDNRGGSDQRGYDQRGRQDHDPGYKSWRDRQMESFDRDYDEYRREHQSRFDNEFRTWREGRQGQRDLLGKVEEHFEVLGSDGQHVGTVDHVRGDQIELTKTDKDAGGKHHYIPSSWLQTVEGNKVMLSKTADQAKQHWRDEARDAGGDRERGGLNRSFSGTY